MLDVRKLVLLREVGARGSIAAAAEALNYTRSAVSQQLSALEAETGVALLDRGSNRVVLTPAGRLLVGHTDHIVTRLETAESELLASIGRVTGDLRVGVPVHEGPALLVPAVTRLRAAHPGLRITLHAVASAEARQSVRLGNLDAVLSARYPQVPAPEVPGLHEEEVLEDRIRLAVAPDHPSAGDTARPLSDFARLPWLLDPSSDLGRLALHACTAAGFTPDIVSDIGDMQAVLGLVSRGWGVALVPDLVPDRTGHPVRRVALSGPPLTRRTTLTVRKGALSGPAVAALLPAVRAAADEVTGDA
ncbi:LysR family transcriptional regulator [Streptomyces sp. SID9913]|uniref:LysR family transcriptional regulator n=2 Tax=unclassified Streptomyces TaxID=2593676 RepID=A0A6G3QX31_9ACTN|nr:MULTISPECIES: LysR family transcriptional regulator [unclassified Streptomyces]NEA87931.1 LysR family transcriptional regulator [Streptomyces sp. SID14436]NEC80095.1 LysR family transcriptional regulator [Streptomyces sp. SID7958]NED16623.1 LysR family transcriptional regulator [Streptomyces sp. SID9913]